MRRLFQINVCRPAGEEGELHMVRRLLIKHRNPDYQQVSHVSRGEGWVKQQQLLIEIFMWLGFIIPKVSPCLRVWFTPLCLPPPIISSKFIHPRTTPQSSLTSLLPPPPTLNHPLSLYFQFQVCLWSDFQVCPILWISLHLPTFRPSSLLPWTNGKPPKCLVGLQDRITTSSSVKEEAPLSHKGNAKPPCRAYKPFINKP